MGSDIIVANLNKMEGIKMLGILVVHIDYIVNGKNSPSHTHLRATKAHVLLEGMLLVGFIDTWFFSKMLEKGYVFVLPKGLVHFQ